MFAFRHNNSEGDPISTTSDINSAGEQQIFTGGEFRSLVLASLNRLNQKDTLRKGTDELLHLVDQLHTENDSLGIFVVFIHSLIHSLANLSLRSMNNNLFLLVDTIQNCLLDGQDNQPPSYKKESMRVLAITCNVHGIHLQSYLPKIVLTIICYLKVEAVLTIIVSREIPV